MIPGIYGDTIHVNSVVVFWMEREDQRIFGLSAAAPSKDKKLPTEVLWLSGQ